MKTGYFRGSLILTMLIAAVFTLSCSGVRDVYEVSSEAANSITDLMLPDEKPVLKKKVLIAPVINRSDISSAVTEQIRKDCVAYLADDKYIVVNTFEKWNDTDPGFIQKEYGAVINPSYVKTAAEMGMNILMTCVIHPMEIDKKRTGIWPFRKDSHIIMLSMSINAVDTVNGTLVVFKNVNTTFKAGTVDPGDNEKWVPDYNMFIDEISSLTKELCSSVIEKLRKTAWQSPVSIDSDNLVIKAGKDVGIDDNTIFELYKKGEPLGSFSGEEYFGSGDKIGETGVKSVSVDRAVLAVDKNMDYKNTAYVRVKQVD